MKALKIIGWTLLSLVLVVVAVVTIACYLIFTPERLTPIARQVADKYVTCEHEIGRVDLTFFSTFPYFGVAIQDVRLINPKAGAQSDTLLDVPELVVSLQLMDAIDGHIRVERCRLKDAEANIYIAADGSTNFDVFDLPASEKDTVQKESGWQLKSLEWDEDIRVTARELTFEDEKDTISASLRNTDISLAALERSGMHGARLDLKSEDIHATVKGVTYADSVQLQLRLPAILAEDKSPERVFIDGTKLQLNEFDLTLDGEVGTPDFSSGEYNMDLRLKTGKWDIESLLALVPQQFLTAMKDIDLSGAIRLDATAKGTLRDSLMPVFTAHVDLTDAAGAYKPLPYPLRDVELEADAVIDLNNGKASSVTLHQLKAKTKKTSLSANGQIDELLADMLMNLQLQLDANLPDFAYFLPKEMTLDGTAKGKASMKMRLSDLTNMRLQRGKIQADLDLKNIRYAMDSMVAELPSTHAVVQLPNPTPSREKVNWARIDLTTDQIDYTMLGQMSAKLEKSAVQLEAGNMLSKDPVIYATLGLQTDDPLMVYMDTIGGTIAAPQLKAYVAYNTKDKDLIPTAEATLDCQSLNGYFANNRADLKETHMQASLSPGKTDKSVPVMKAQLRTSAFKGNMGQELAAETDLLNIEAASRYNKKGENFLLQWNPRLKVNLNKGVLDMPERLPETVKIPTIDFSYSNREMAINSARVELGQSDLNMKGNVRNIGQWFRHEEILEGELDIISDHCNANQLIEWFSADKGSEEQATATAQPAPAPTPAPAAQADTVKKETEPFLVPTDVNLAIKTHMREVEIFNQVARDLKGGLYVKDGTLILDEMGFVCRAAKLQLTAMYRTPRRNHIYLGLDYHMLEVNIDELISMIPNLEQMVPMLSSFKGAAEFHLAAETYLNSQYEPKMSTLRGAASLTGKDLVVMDGETFSKISKLLLFKKKTENLIDSINAEMTVYKNEIDIYPLCVSMDNYMVALGGRHNTDMTFNYDINVLRPIYLGVNVSGNIDNLKIKLAKCKFAQDFRPHWYQKVDTQSLELRERIKRSMEKNVRLETGEQKSE